MVASRPAPGHHLIGMMRQARSPAIVRLKLARTVARYGLEEAQPMSTVRPAQAGEPDNIA
jgi:hypothetical protein